MKIRLTLLALLCLFSKFSFAQCSETGEPKVLLVGDSWAFFMMLDQTFNHVFEKWGHSDSQFYSNAVIAENGAETDDFLLQTKQDEIAAQLIAKPSIKAVHLSIGGNDMLGDWNVSYTDQQADSLMDLVMGRLVQVVDFIKSVRPDVQVVIGGYTYPNFEEVIQSAAPFQTSHPFYSRWQDMGFPNFEEINTRLNDFTDIIAAYADGDSRVEFVRATGLMQYTYGQTSPLGVAPGGTYPPRTVPLPEGDPTYPSPKNSMRDYGITKDCFHLSAGGYSDLIEFQTQKFYHRHLMHDRYFVPEHDVRTGAVSSSGSTSTLIDVGESGGERFAAVLTFNTTSLPDSNLSKASIFLRRESLSGNNPIDGPWRVRVKNGQFGNLERTDAADYTDLGDAQGDACRFGSNGGDGHWIRLDLPASVLPFIRNDANTQFMLSLPDASGGIVTFSNASDPDFAPVLDLTFGQSPLAVPEQASGTFNVFPNPSPDLLHIDAAGQTIRSLQVRNITGQTVLRQQTASTTLDISTLPAGTFFLGVETENGRSEKTIVKR